MAAKPRRIEITGSTNILDVVDDVERTHEPMILQRGGRDAVVVSPINLLAEKIFSGQDPLLNLVGVDTSEGDADTSTNIHAYLADAYEHR
jgi:hypothetical protein